MATEKVSSIVSSEMKVVSEIVRPQDMAMHRSPWQCHATHGRNERRWLHDAPCALVAHQGASKKQFTVASVKTFIMFLTVPPRTSMMLSVGPRRRQPLREDDPHQAKGVVQICVFFCGNGGCMLLAFFMLFCIVPSHLSGSGFLSVTTTACMPL